jgi:hypothetical protein
MLKGNDGKSGDDAADKVASAEAAPAAAPTRSAKGEPELDNDLPDLAGAFGMTQEAPAKEAPESVPGSAAEPEKATEAKQDELKSGKPEASESTESMDERPANEHAGKESKSSEIPPKPAEKEEAEEEPAEKKPEKTEAGEEKKQPEKKPPHVDPFKDFPKAVGIPILSDNDPPGEASKAVADLGTIHGPADVNWQLLLLGGDKFLKGGRSFVLARTEPDASKAAWSIRLSGGSSNEGEENVARLWRDGEVLKFQWSEKAPGASANYLRNCMIQIRVAGDSRYLALTEPIQAEPIVLDLLRGQSNGSVAIRWAPEDELLRFKFDKIEGVEKATFEPAEPVAPKTPVALNFVYTDRYKNDTNAVTFRILPTSRRTSLSLDVRLPDSASRLFKSLVGNYNEQQLGVAIDRMGNTRQDLERKLTNQKGEDAQKTTREIDAINGQIWLLQFFLKAHKKAAIHYQVVTDVGGQELVLAGTR